MKDYDINKNPFTHEFWSAKEQYKISKENPDVARQLFVLAVNDMTKNIIPEQIQTETFENKLDDINETFKNNLSKIGKERLFMSIFIIICCIISYILGFLSK